MNLVNPIVIFLTGEEEGDAEVDGQEEEVRGEGWLQSGGEQEEEVDDIFEAIKVPTDWTRALWLEDLSRVRPEEA